MKFFAPTDEPLHLALTSGHTAVVMPEGTELHVMFHRQAVANGATTTETTVNDEMNARTFSIEQALEDAAVANTDGIFDKQRKLVLHKLIAKLGFQVNRQEMEAAWQRVQQAMEKA